MCFLTLRSCRTLAESGAVNDLVKLRLQVESEGLKLMALENVPTHFYLEIMLGGPNRDRQIENMIETVRNIGAAGHSDVRIQLDAVARLAYPAGTDPRRCTRDRVRLRRSIEDAEHARTRTY